MSNNEMLRRGRRLRLGFAALGAVVLATLSACSGSSAGTEKSGSASAEGGEPSYALVETMKKRGHAILGMVDSPPSSWVESDGVATGYNVEIAKRLLSKYGIDTVEPFQAEFAGMIPGLQAGTMDISVAGMLITPERCDTLAMSAATNAMSFSFLTKEGNPDNLTTVEEVKESGAKLAVEGATAQERIVREVLDDSQVVIVGDRQGGADAVRIGRADAYILPLSSAEQVIDAPGEPLDIVTRVEDTPVIGSAFALRLDDADFAEALREDFNEMVDSGEYAEIMEEFGADPDTLSLPNVQLTCE